MRKWLRRLVIVGVVIGLIVGGGVAVSAWWKTQSAAKYLTATVSRGRVETVVNSTGTIKPVRTISVGAFTSGPIAEVYVDYNSRVKEGCMLAEIDDKLPAAAVEHDKAALDAQRADLARVQALLEQAKNNEDRARKLFAVNKDYISDTEMDQYLFARITAEKQVALSAASVKQAEAQLQNSRDNLGYTKIRSPEDGIVMERKVDPGQTVASSYQTPELFTIGVEMEKHMFVYASVDEADVGQIREAQKQGRSVSFTVDAYPGDLFTGKIEQIRLNSTTTQNVVTYPVVIDAPNLDVKLMPGMTANLTFQIDAKDDVLRIPAAALRFAPQPSQVRPEDRRYLDGLPANSSEAAPKSTAVEKVEKAHNRQNRRVWIKDGDLLRAVPVTLGLVDNQNAEIVTGDLKEGQLVVTGNDSIFAPR
ncbi:MAG TPA: efflux RND transporter periplasmic adaptor subunit [Gemmataceae bacterium]|nr:efflux RND transporter periplasmic adaptor subunit [Gemmataceae bacterium]